MALVDPKSGKLFQTGSFAQLSASVAATGKLGGVTAAFVDEKNIPYRLTRGDQSLYFDITKVETGSIIRKNDGTVYVPYKKKNWQDMIIGPGSFVSESFDTNAYLQVSASFAKTWGGLDDDFIIVQRVEEFYPVKETRKVYKQVINTFVGPVTASYTLRESTGVTQSFSGIDNGSGVTLVVENNSSYATHNNWTIGSAGNTGMITQSILFPSWSHQFNYTGVGGISSSVSLIESNYAKPTSGSEVGSGELIYVNNTNGNAGQYMKFLIKGRIAGDADSGSLYSFLEDKEIAIYTATSPLLEVASGSFQYSATNEVDATGSSDFRTLYYVKSKTNSGPSGSYTGSLVLNTAPLGSLIHGDAELKTTASYGYYHVPGTSGPAEVYLISSSAVDNAGNPIEHMIIPRIIRRFNVT